MTHAKQTVKDWFLFREFSSVTISTLVGVYLIWPQNVQSSLGMSVHLAEPATVFVAYRRLLHLYSPAQTARVDMELFRTAQSDLSTRGPPSGPSPPVASRPATHSEAVLWDVRCSLFSVTLSLMEGAGCARGAMVNMGRRGTSDLCSPPQTCSWNQNSTRSVILPKWTSPGGNRWPLVHVCPLLYIWTRCIHQLTGCCVFSIFSLWLVISVCRCVGSPTSHRCSLCCPQDERPNHHSFYHLLSFPRLRLAFIFGFPYLQHIHVYAPANLLRKFIN